MTRARETRVVVVAADDDDARPRDAARATTTPRFVRVWDFLAARATELRATTRAIERRRRAGRGDAGETRAKARDVARAAGDAAKAEFEAATRGRRTGEGATTEAMSTTRAATGAAERGEDARGRRERR